MRIVVSVIALLALTVALVGAEVPQVISFQGRAVSSSDGEPIATGHHAMTFRLYTLASGGTPLWTEYWSTVQVTDGLYNVLLGSNEPLSGVINWDQQLYLGISISSDPEMTPRYQLASSSTALNADMLDGHHALWTIGITDEADTSIISTGSWGLRRSGNVAYGNADSTHTNLGVSCTTGTDGQNYKYCTVSGGKGNTASGNNSVVAGGSGNTASGIVATIGGGSANTSSEQFTTVGGGLLNTSSGFYAVVSGGHANHASDNWTTIGGGGSNTCSAQFTTVSGGDMNTASSAGASVGGGVRNTSSASEATISGGLWNYAGANYSAIPGGYADSIGTSGTNSLVFGNRVLTNTPYRAYFFNTTHPGALAINRDDVNGVWVPFQVGSTPADGNSAYLTGGGVWTNASSRTFKDRFVEMNGADVLDKIAGMEIKGWYYKTTNEYHIWPFAEDFYQAFGTGVEKKDDASTHLAAGDVAGVGLVAIQELAKENKELRSIVTDLQKKITALELKIEKR